jgi:uncharacterized repeat protein (TIGR04138 family)
MSQIPVLEEVVRRDPRYTYEAYEFVFLALEFTQNQLDRKTQEDAEGESEGEGDSHHVSGPELLDGIRELALRDFGLMARTVFRHWGINKTDDFGNIVFNLIEANLMSKTEGDDPRDFCDVYDLDRALVHEFHITASEAE